MPDILPDMKFIYSGHINAVGYDERAKILYVEWTTGKISAYSGVPVEVAQATMNAWSVGEAVAHTIKPNYPHRYVAA